MLFYVLFLFYFFPFSNLECGRTTIISSRRARSPVRENFLALNFSTARLESDWNPIAIRLESDCNPIGVRVESDECFLPIKSFPPGKSLPPSTTLPPIPPPYTTLLTTHATPRKTLRDPGMSDNHYFMEQALRANTPPTGAHSSALRFATRRSGGWDGRGRPPTVRKSSADVKWTVR